MTARVLCQHAMSGWTGLFLECNKDGQRALATAQPSSGNGRRPARRGPKSQPALYKWPVVAGAPVVLQCLPVPVHLGRAVVPKEKPHLLAPQGAEPSGRAGGWDRQVLSPSSVARAAKVRWH